MERGDVLRKFVFLFLLLSGGCTMIGKPNAMTRYSDAMSRRSDGTARQLLAEAQRLADAGDTDGAMNLMKRANALPAEDKDPQPTGNGPEASSPAATPEVTAR